MLRCLMSLLVIIYHIVLHEYSYAEPTIGVSRTPSLDTNTFLRAPVYLDNLLRKPLRPLFLAPRAGDLVRDQAVEDDCRRDVDAVLPAKLDYENVTAFVRDISDLGPCEQLTRVLEVVCDSDAAIGRGLERQGVKEGSLLVLSYDRGRELR